MSGGLVIDFSRYEKSYSDHDFEGSEPCISACFFCEVPFYKMCNENIEKLDNWYICHKCYCTTCKNNKGTDDGSDWCINFTCKKCNGKSSKKK